MAEENKIKISEMAVVSTMTGNEMFPVEVDGGNGAVRATLLKEYFRDSGLLPFDEFDGSTVTLINGTASAEDGAELSIVYLTKRNVFALRKTITGFTPSYYSEFLNKDGYMANGVPRADRVFFCLADKAQHVWNGTALEDPYSPIVLTQEEYDALTTKDENRTYYIYEEE